MFKVIKTTAAPFTFGGNSLHRVGAADAERAL